MKSQFLHIFQIQNFCLQDGDGVRTTVFLKGCPLQCVWCHNPESQSAGPQIAFNRGLCLQCGRCFLVCPEAVHGWEKHDSGIREHTVDFSSCTGCGSCALVCPAQCMELIGREADIRTLAAELLQDRPFWGPEGGITFSGGEPLAQAEGVRALARILKEQNCNLVMETSGYAGKEQFEAVWELIDEWYFDFKAGPAWKHKALCGQDNRLIHDNFRRLFARGGRIRVRYPVVPGINDSAEDFKVLYELLKSTSLSIPVELLPYHILGKGKKERTGGAYAAFLPQENADQDYIEEKKNQLRREGVRIC